LPGEQGEAVDIWRGAKYQTVSYLYADDEDYADYDFSRETAENWQKEHGRAALVITFLPTSWEN